MKVLVVDDEIDVKILFEQRFRKEIKLKIKISKPYSPNALVQGRVTSNKNRGTVPFIPQKHLSLWAVSG